MSNEEDWEDMVFMMNNCAELVNSIKKCDNKLLVSYFNEQLGKLLKNNNIQEIINSALPYYAKKKNIEKILSIMNEIQNL